MVTRRTVLGAAVTALAVALRGRAHAADGAVDSGSTAGPAAAAGNDPAAALRSRIVYKGEQKYEAYRKTAVWNALKPNRFPEAIVMAESVDDVIAAVKLARQRGWQVGTRSGGHSWVAPHMRDNSILINISRMKELSVDASARIARVSPAWQGQAFNKVLRDDYDLMFPTGHCYGIGLGGFVMAGGHGWNSRIWGPGCAQLVALDLVNADGELVHASETENSDLLWAARGGGAGFPGVAVRFHLKLYPRPHVMKAGMITLPMDLADEVLHWFGEFQLRIPRELEVFLRGRIIDGRPVLQIAANLIAYDEKVADQAFAMLDACPGISRAIERHGPVAVVFPGESESPATLSPTGARYVTDGAWSNASTAKIVRRIRPLFDAYPTKESWYLWMAWGKVQKLPDMAYSIQGHSYLSPNAVWYDPADDAKCAEWAANCIDAVRDISAGGQMNDDNMAVNGLPYLSRSAAARLARIQAKHDPGKRFAGFLVKT